jgi:hypothetical protein
VPRPPPAAHGAPASPLVQAARSAAEVRYLLAPFNDAEKREIEELRVRSNRPLAEVVVSYQRANQNAQCAAALIRVQ